MFVTSPLSNGREEIPLLLPSELKGGLPIDSCRRSNQVTMTALFRRIQPPQKFRLTKHQIAKFLRIPESLIVKVESWLYILFVHRLDKGGQFISYRQMEQWKNAVACQLQKCSTRQQLEHLWNDILVDHTKHNSQYVASVLPFLEKIWLKCLEAILMRSHQTPNDNQENNLFYSWRYS